MTDVSASSNPGCSDGIVRGQSGHRCEVPAGRAAGHEDDVRIGAVLGPVLAHPGEHLLHIDERIGELRAQPVVRADADPSAAREPVEERPRLAALVADAERPAVQVDERRPGARVRPRPIHVEQVRAPRVAVGDVRDSLDSRVRHRERPEEDPERQSARCASGQPSGDQRVVDRGARPHRPQHHDDEPGGREHGQPEPDPADRVRDVSLPDRERGRSREHVEGEERQLVDHEPEPEAEAHRARAAAAEAAPRRTARRRPSAPS